VIDLGAALIVVFLIGLAIGAYAWLAPRAVRTAPAEVRPEPPPWIPDEGWTAQAGAEFAGLAESARCDLVFAVADLTDDRSRDLLVHALDDPSDAVALAAAHALNRRGSRESVNVYAESHPGERAQRILDELTVLEG
jgi:hypothetical protein